MPQLAEVQAEAAFKQNHRNSQLDDRFLQSTEIPFGIDDTQNRASNDADNQHQGDSGTARPPGDPLRADTEQADQRDLDHE